VNYCLWKKEEIEILFKNTYEIPFITGVSIDTRTLEAGDLFVALNGVRDGHDFVTTAFEKGASAALVHHDAILDAPESQLIRVPDTLRSLEDLGRFARARTKAHIIAVTGSVGKTSVKEALRTVFASAYKTHASVASYNNHFGVPLTLARMPRDTQIAIFEIGMSAMGEIAVLTRMVRPHTAIITTVAPVHLEFFPSVAAIADAKGEIFLGLESGGTAIIPADILEYSRLMAHAQASKAGRVLTFASNTSGVRATRILLQGDASTVEAEVLGAHLTYRVNVAGEHMARNSLAVLAAAQAAGMDLAKAGLALAHWRAGSGRGERHTLLLPSGGEAILLDESYNANPASMRASLATLKHINIGSRGRRIAVLGDMLELGVTAPSLHADLAQSIIGYKIDTVIACGALMRHLWESLPSEVRAPFCETPEDALKHLRSVMGANDVILIKGSNGSGMHRVVKALLCLGLT
jgi:UDP-N-acetylmuramoyl-tripeptide--D-alanyl-D-alanine ligase